MQLDASHPVLADAAFDLRRGVRVARIDRRERDEPVGCGTTQAASESFAAALGRSSPSYVNTTEMSTPSSSIAARYSVGP